MARCTCAADPSKLSGPGQPGGEGPVHQRASGDAAGTPVLRSRERAANHDGGQSGGLKFWAAPSPQVREAMVGVDEPRLRERALRPNGPV